MEYFIVYIPTTCKYYGNFNFITRNRIHRSLDLALFRSKASYNY
jgi:hypothetical protein